MEKSKLPYTQIVIEDGAFKYSGVVRKGGVNQSNSNEVLIAFNKTFKVGEIVDVIIKRR